MNKFVWRLTKRAGEVDYRHSFLQVFEPDGIKFWGILKPEGDLYSPVVLNAQRNGYLTVPDLLILKDAKEAVEKKLFDDGVIQDGDIVEDETE